MEFTTKNLLDTLQRYVDNQKEQRNAAIKLSKESAKNQREIDKAFDPTFKKMTLDEQNELMRLSFRGMIQYDFLGNATVLMGTEQINEYDEYKNKMIEKYSTQIDK